MKKLYTFFLGAPKNPFEKGTRKNIALIAFLAWIGLGADGLSSSTYGPAEAFLALGPYSHLALYLAVLTALTVFIIALGYNQVIELFPSGGGGYKVASRLIHPRAGLVSGSALIVDYTLTITISIASGIDALFSLLPLGTQHYKLHFEVLSILILMCLNLRGMKESIKVLMPIFLGFVITHFALIIYGIWAHNQALPTLVADVWQETTSFAEKSGWFVVLALFLRAYSLGGGTYTGIEAVSNNVNHLRAPQVKTGKWTMFYMALSLSVTAGGIILLYLLWDVVPVSGKTLNAVLFQSILGEMPLHHFALMLVLCLEAGLLFLAANTGFLGGPAVLANMSLDGWTPKRFRNLSNRLVTQNGVILYGLFAIFILFWTHGKVSMLVVLYSMNVFLTFSLSLLGLCIYRVKNYTSCFTCFYKTGLCMLGFLVCISILVVTVVEKFTAGGWMTIFVTSSVITYCVFVQKHYRLVAKQITYLDKLLTLPLLGKPKTAQALLPSAPTAVFLVNESTGQCMHTLLGVRRMFPNHFKNFIFISAGVVDVGSYGSESSLKKMRHFIKKKLQYFVDFSRENGMPATAIASYGHDPVHELIKISEKISARFMHTVFFSATLVSKQDSWFHRTLHSDVPLLLQRYLLLRGLQMFILPVRLER